MPFNIKLRYHGRLTHPKDAEELANEVEDICRTNGWRYNRWDEDWSKANSVKMAISEGVIVVRGHAPLRGITFSPHNDSETVWLTFTPDGVLNSLFTLADRNWTSSEGGHAWHRVQTGFDGAKTHLLICNLFGYLQKKYFLDFDCDDESGFWKHKDEDRLEKFMFDLGEKIAQMEEELEALESDDSISQEDKNKIYKDILKQYSPFLKRGDADV